MGIGDRMVQILKSRGVEVVHYGESSNVARGNANIKCPYCGEEDSKQHMGIRLDSGVWGCWRSAAHRGRAPEKLLAKVLRVSLQQARAMLGIGGAFQIEDDDFSRLLDGSVFRDEIHKEEARTQQNLVDRFRLRLIDGSRVSFYKFYRYLYDRGFSKDTDRLIDQYQILCALTREFSNRVVFPIRNKEGVLVSFTGRSIFKDATLRYKACPDSDALVAVKDCLFNAEQVEEGGRVLVVQEGPLDVYKLDFYGKKYGVRSVGLMTVSLTAARTQRIRELADRFEKVVVMQDLGMEMNAHQVSTQLLLPSKTKLATRYIPKGWKDVGEMDKKSVTKLAKALAEER